MQLLDLQSQIRALETHEAAATSSLHDANQEVCPAGVHCLQTWAPLAAVSSFLQLRLNAVSIRSKVWSIHAQGPDTV